MDLEQKTLRIGAVAVFCAVLLRLISNGVPEAIVAALSKPQVASAILYLETGRVLRAPEPQLSAAPPETAPPETAPPPSAAAEPTEPAEATEPEAVQAVFSVEDAQLVEVNSLCSYGPDMAQLMAQPLDWDLTTEAPSVLILHSHASESYTNTENYTESSDYRTLDEAYNMVSIGDRLAACLEAGGIGVLHDRVIHDYPSYNDAYAHARQTAEAYLAEYPSIQLILDIHRDAAQTASGGQIAYTVNYGGQDTAQLMLVIGTDAGGLTHPEWLSNMALAGKLHAQLEKLCPGICRPISLRSQRFNQDLSPGALLVEVGAAGNTRQEALQAAELLAQGILTLAHGATTADSTTESFGLLPQLG